MPTSTSRRKSDQEPGQCFVSGLAGTSALAGSSCHSLRHTCPRDSFSRSYHQLSWRLFPGGAVADQVCGCLPSPLQRLSSPSILWRNVPSPQSVLGPHPIWLPQEAPQTTPAWLFFISPRSHFNGASTRLPRAAGSRLTFKPLILVLALPPSPTWALSAAHLPGRTSPLSCSVWPRTSNVAIIGEPARNTASQATPQTH